MRQLVISSPGVVELREAETLWVPKTALSHFRWWLDVVMCHDQS